MADLLYYIVEKMAGIHDVLMTLNDSYETMFSDKELHFIVIGVLGMALLFVIFPLFKALSRHHVLVIAWIYVPVYHICGAEGDCSWHCTSGQRYYGPG